MHWVFMGREMDLVKWTTKWTMVKTSLQPGIFSWPIFRQKKKNMCLWSNCFSKIDAAMQRFFFFFFFTCEIKGTPSIP